MGALTPGQRFGRYRIERPLGAGGMGQVFVALDTVLEREIALKVIRPESTEREEALARFRREAKAAAKLNHRNVVAIFDLGEVEDTSFIAMELIIGQPLSAYCRGTPATTAQKLSWIADVARGLAAAHKLDLIHRDVKPANVMVNSEGVGKLVDFGLAKGQVVTKEMKTMFRTMPGFVVGTPAYMAPEQHATGVSDTRTDEFAWGLTAYVLLTGANPRDRNPLLTNIRRVHDVVPDVPAELGDAIARALALRPTDRNGSLAALADRFEAAARDPARAAGLRAQSSPPAPSDDAATNKDPVPEHATTRTSTAPLAPVRNVVGEISHPAVVPGPVPLVPAHATMVLAPDAHAVTLPPPAPDLPLTWEIWQTADECPLPGIRHAAFMLGGMKMIAFGDDRAQVYEGGWSPVWTVCDFEVGLLRGCIAMGDGTLAAVGENGLALRIEMTATQMRNVETLAAHGAHAEIPIEHRGVSIGKGGDLLLAGNQGRSGTLLRIGRNAMVTYMLDRPIEHAVELASGAIVACGARGYVATIHDGEIRTVPCPREADFVAVRHQGNAAIAVGAQATAARIDGSSLVLEAIDGKPSDICALSTGDETWAGTADGRLLRRSNGAWKTLWKPAWRFLRAVPKPLAIHVERRNLIAIFTDGSIVRGTGRPAA